MRSFGISHGDLNPKNILVDKNGEVKVVDWETWLDDDKYYTGNNIFYHDLCAPPEFILQRIFINAENGRLGYNLEDVRRAYNNNFVSALKDMLSEYKRKYLKGHKRADLGDMIEQEVYMYLSRADTSLQVENNVSRFGVDLYYIIAPFANKVWEAQQVGVFLDFLKTIKPQRSLGNDLVSYVRQLLRYNFPNIYLIEP